MRLTIQTITLDQLLKDLAQVFGLGLLNRTVDYVGRALLHAKLVHLAKKLRDDLLAYFLVPVLECLLNSIVAVWILRKLDCVRGQLLHEAHPILLECSLCDYELNHAQSVIVHR